jgi:fructose-bisphosphate aldolase class II
MQTLLSTLKEAEKNRVAVGHFNISELATLKAIVEAARETAVPLLVGLSEGEREFMGVREPAALVKILRQEHGLPIFLNADHTHSLARAEAAARAGYDEIVFDLSNLPLEENIRQTKRAVEAVKSIAPETLVEGEVGYIGTSSEVMQEAPAGIGLTTPAEASQFVSETGVDVLAPAVGNMHGMLKNMVQGQARKRLDIARIAEIKAASGALLTLHGGSGTDDDDFRRAIRAGINVIHINTELRVAWRRGLEQALASNAEAVAPYKILPEAVESVKQVVLARLRLFNFLDKQSTGQPAA